MSLSYRTEEYYQRFIELQEKLRKSEEERLKLEMKFNEMVRITKEETQTHYRKLRAQYKRFLEEDRKRQDRNERIMRTLERIESRFVGLNAKTERFKLLRQQYQALLERIYKMNRESENPQEFKIKEFSKQEEPIGERSEILEQYLQNLSSQRVKNLLKKGVDPKGRLSFSLLPEDSLQETLKKDNDDLYHYGEGNFRPNYANSIASDIMDSISLRKPKSTTYELQNNVLGKDQIGGVKVVDEYIAANRRSQGSDTDDELSAVSFKTGFNNSSNLQREDRISTEDIEKEATHSEEIKTVELLPKNQSSELKEPRRDEHLLPELVQDIKEPKLQVLLEKIPFLTEEETKKLIKNSGEKENDSFKHSRQYVQDSSIIHQLGDEKKLGVIQDSDDKIEQPPYYDEQEQFQALNEINKNRQSITKYQKRQYKESDQLVQGYDENGQPVARTPYNQNNQLPQQPDEQLGFDENKSSPNNLRETNKLIHKSEQPIQQYEETIQPQSAQYSTGDQLGEASRALQLNEETTEAQYSGTGDQYDESGQLIQQNEEADQPIEQYDPSQAQYGTNQQYGPQYDENGQLIQQYSETGEAVGEYNENGQLIQQYNSNDQPQYDANGQLIQQYSETGETVGQYDESGQLIQQYGETGEATGEYDANGQLIQQYSETGETVGQYDESGQLVQQYGETGEATGEYDANGQLIQQYSETGETVGQYDESGQLVQQYGETGEAIGEYDANGQLIQQYSETGETVGQYDESGQLIQQYGETGEATGEYDANGQLIQQYSETGETVGQYDESGQLIQQYGETGDAPGQYDVHGQLIQQYNENGESIEQYDPTAQFDQQYDENGQPIQQYSGDEYQYDENGQLIQQYDENEQPIQQYDENGQAIQQYLQPQYDENGTLILQYGEDVQPIQPYGEDVQQYETSGELEQGGDQQYNNSGETAQESGLYGNSGEVVDEMGKNVEIGSEIQKTKEVAFEEKEVKVSNVMHILDTDSESVKQDTKVSNDSDFDFSNE